MRLTRTAAALAASIAFGLTAVAAAGPSPFTGVWKSTDTDGSSQTLMIGGGPPGAPHVQYFDDLATSCGEPFSSATATGSGAISGMTMTVTLSVRCHNGSPNPGATVTYTYDPATNTLGDTFGVVWSRP
jgi:hypothetical protein